MTRELTFRPTEIPQKPQPAHRDGWIIRAAEAGLIPDTLLRFGIRRLSAQRLKEERAGGSSAIAERTRQYLEEWQAGPIALVPEKANEQHYEVPPRFFELTLGRYLKYSCAYWGDGVTDLSTAEAAMLALTCERAELADHQRILELGCGWGSLSLWMAEHYPHAQITSVSNSTPQRQWIEQQAQERGLNNLTVVTADINDFETSQTFDRVVSVEMFEHCRNHQELFRRASGWLATGGKLFTHVFCHRDLYYPYESRGEGDWMARHFFSGGVMPSYDLFTQAQQSLSLENRWWFDGGHYQKTSEAWLDLLDQHRDEVSALFAAQGQDGPRATQRWRMFYMAVAEMFGYAGGQEWGVGHYLFHKP